MAKNLDGIKKLNPEEIKKDRKIVLNYIGEKDADLPAPAGLTKEPRLANLAVVASNRVDGIRLNKMPERPAPEKNNFAEEEIVGEKAEREALAKKEIAKKAKFEAEKKAQREKLKLEERLIRENERLAEIKQAAETKRIKAEVKLAKFKAAVKRKIKRQKALKLFKNNLYNKLSEIFVIIKKNLVYGALCLIVFLAASYAVFCLLVLRFKIDNNIVGKLARFLPAPAVITNQGIINYNDWRDIKNNNYAGLNSAEKKNSLAKLVVLKNLSGKYGLPVNSPGKVLAIAFAADEDFNQVGLSRIKKISQFLKNAGGLEPLSKYADEFSEVVYYNNKSAVEKFGPAILNLNDNQLSDIIFRDNGYYIAQIVDRRNGRLGVKYLFVGAKTLDQYLSEKIAKIKIFILAN